MSLTQQQQQLSMCLELLRDLWGPSGSLPPTPFVLDIWLPDYGSDADVPSEVRSRVRAALPSAASAAALLRVVPNNDAQRNATTTDDAVGRSHALFVLRAATNELDRRMATPDGELKAPVAPRVAALAASLYSERARLVLESGTAFLAVLDSCRAIAFALRDAAPYALAVQCASAAKMRSVAVEIGQRGLAIARQSQGTASAEQSEALAVLRRAIMADVVMSEPPQPATTAPPSSGGAARAAPIVVTALPRGLTRVPAEPEAALREQLDKSWTVLRALWSRGDSRSGNAAAELPRAFWLFDWQRALGNMDTSPAELRALRDKDAADLKAEGNAAWSTFVSDRGSDSDGKRARLLYTAALAKIDVTVRARQAARALLGSKDSDGAAPVDGDTGGPESKTADASEEVLERANTVFALAHAQGSDSEEQLHALASSVYSNRSLLHLRTGDSLLALVDAVHAAAHDTAALKPCYRGIIAAQTANETTMALQFCKRGMDRGGGSDPHFTAAASELVATLRTTGALPSRGK